jgi:hypothetical protein
VIDDDDILRRALHRPTEPISSYHVLQDLRPTMRRARNRRRAGVGAAAALVLLGGGAGVFALTSASLSPTVRTTPSSYDNGATATLPPVTEPRDVAENEPFDDRTVPAVPAAPAATEPSTAVVPEDDGQTEAAVPAPPTPQRVPSPAAPTPTPAPTPAPVPPPEPVAPAPAPVAPTSHVLSSSCGDIVVEISGGTVRISSMTPLDGYAPQVATDGPESVEMKLVGAGDSCEVHAELTASGLDVEIQNSGHDDD